MPRAKPAAAEPTTEPLDPSPLLKPDDAARYLGISARTLANWRTRETGPPFVRVSRRCVMYRPLDLQQWLSGMRHKPTGADTDERRAQAKHRATTEGVTE